MFQGQVTGLWAFNVTGAKPLILWDESHSLITALIIMEVLNPRILNAI